MFLFTSSMLFTFARALLTFLGSPMAKRFREVSRSVSPMSDLKPLSVTIIVVFTDREPVR